MRRPISTSKATAGSKPRPSVPTSSPAPAAGSAPSKSTKPTRRCTALGCSRTSTSARRVAGSLSRSWKIRSSTGSSSRATAGSRTSSLSPRLVERTWNAVARRRSIRRAAHRRGLSPQRPLRRHRRSENHRFAERPRRPGLRGHGRRQDHDPGHRIRRQPRLFVLAAEVFVRTTQTNILSFLQSTNIYDQDRLEADRELLRRFYLKNGYIDVRIVAAAAEFDPGRNGFVVAFTIEEGEQYRVGRSTSARTSAPSIPG